MGLFLPPIDWWFVFLRCLLNPGFRLVNTKCMMLVDMWKKIQHSNSVTLREVFTTKAFGDHCECAAGPFLWVSWSVKWVNLKPSLLDCCLCSALVFSYDFHAGAETMYSRHFNDPAADSYFTKRKWGELPFSTHLLFCGDGPCTPSLTRQTFAYSHIFFFVFWVFWKHYSYNLRLWSFFISHGYVKSCSCSMFLHPRFLARAECLGWMFWCLRADLSVAFHCDSWFEFLFKREMGDLWSKLILRQVLFSSPTGTSTEEAKVAFFFLFFS